jgi:hypothetical protein
MEFLFVVSRYYFSKGLIIMVVLFTVLAVGMYVYGRLQQKNAFRKSVNWLGCLAVSSMILLALLYICNIRNPKVFVGNVTITSDETVEGESGIDITFFLDTYDMRGLQLEVSAEVTREYKGENDVDYQSSVGSDNTSEGMMGRTKTLYLSDRDAQYHTIHIPYKALYHKKGLNSYSVAIRTYYIDGNRRTYLYNGDGYHAYSHTFKTSNVDKSKGTKKSNTEYAKKIEPQSNRKEDKKVVASKSDSHQRAASVQEDYTPMPPLTYSARSWSESSSAFGINSHTYYQQSSDGWITREYHQQCTMCGGTGKCKICAGLGGKWSGMYYMSCMGCGGSGSCSLCKGTGEYMSSTTRYLPLDEYYQAGTGDVVHLSGNGNITIHGVAGNIVLSSQDFTVDEYGGYYHFGGSIGHSYVSYLPYPSCKLSKDRNTLYIEDVLYTRCPSSKYKNAQKFYEQMCAQMGVQPYYFYVPDMSSSNSTSYSTSSSSTHSSMSDRYGYKSCPVCHGSGQCQSCNKYGVATSPYSGTHYECGVCGGTHRCRTCQGTGKIYGLK